MTLATSLSVTAAAGTGRVVIFTKHSTAGYQVMQSEAGLFAGAYEGLGRPIQVTDLKATPAEAWVALHAHIGMVMSVINGL